MADKDDISVNSVPTHIAVIMDGNGRWANARGLPRTMGHKKGAESARNIVTYAAEAGVQYITLFGFSSENWKRPESEISDLMGLLRQYLRSQTAEFHKNNARLSVIGDRAAFAGDIVQLIENAEDLTKNNSGIHVIIALNYGGRNDIVQAAQALAQKSLDEGALISDEEAAEFIDQNLLTRGIPDPDLLIRTSGEMRISNFLLWQCAYSEMVFIPTLWPDFSKEDFQFAMDEYQKRDRRYGDARCYKS